MGVIFDLDQTVVDSKIAEPFRGKNWPKVYELIPQFKEYNGINDAFKFIRKVNLKIAIVSTSPKVYCQRVLAHWEIPYDCLVGYHDTKQIKPHPAPMHRALELLKMDSSMVISFGDRATDIESSKAANIKSVGCIWDSSDSLMNCSPDYIARHPNDIAPIITGFFKISKKPL